MIDRYRVVYLLIILIALTGFLSYVQLPKEVYPEMRFPYVMVEIAYPGAAPEDVEKLVTNKIETAVRSVGDIVKLTSESSQGYSSVEIKFRMGVDLSDKINKVKTEVDQIREDLPSSIMNPNVSEYSLSKDPILIMNLGGPYENYEVMEFAKVLKNRIRGVDGVNKVNTYGDIKQEISIHVDPARMSQYAIGENDLINALKSHNTDVPAGLQKLNGQFFALRIKNTYSEISEIENTMITVINGYPIYLKDIAEVKHQNEPEEDYSLTPINFKKENETFKRVLSMQIIKQKGTDTIRVNEEIREIVSMEKGRSVPEDLEVQFVTDMSEYIKKSQKDVFGSAFSGLLIVIVVLFFFINLKESLIVASVIPISLLISIALFKYFGVTFNILSLMGLIIALGMLVDNAIVVIESFDDVKKDYNNASDAAKAGTSKVAAAIFASTLTTVIAFLPLTMMTGDLGQAFKSVPIAAILALLASFGVSLVITPVFASKILSARESEVEKQSIPKKIFLILFVVILSLYGFADNGKLTALSFIGAGLFGFAIYVKLFKMKGSMHDMQLIKRYERWLSETMRSNGKRWTAMILAVMMFFGAVAIMLSPLIQKEAFNKTDTTAMSIGIELKAGSTLQETEKVVMKVHEILKQKDYVKSYSAIVGSDGRHMGLIQIVLVHRKERDLHSREIKLELTREVKALTGAKFVVSDGEGEGTQLEIRLESEDVEAVKATVERLQNALEGIEGIEDSWSNTSNGIPQMIIEFDDKKAAMLGVNLAEAGLTIRQAINGEKISTFVKANKETKIMFRSNGEVFGDVSDLGKLHFVSDKGVKIPFDTIGKITIREGVSTIEHLEGKRIAKLYVLTGEGTTAATVVEKLQEVIAADPHSVEPNVKLNFGGDYEDMQKSFGDLMMKLLIVMIMIYAVLVIQFNSFMQPFVILLAVPMAIIGVAIGYLLIRINFGVMSFMGIVSLAGIAVNDSIVLIDTVNQLRRNEGLDPVQSIIQAGKSRFIPVLATSVTTIGGVLPLALFNEDYSQMAYTLIFGLVSSTVLILVIIPLILHQLERFIEWIQKLVNRRSVYNEVMETK